MFRPEDIRRLGLGNGLTTDEDLRAALPGVKIYSSDGFARNYRHMKAGDLVIINLDRGFRNGGTHWVAVKISDDGRHVLYKDSFGFPPPLNVCKAVTAGRSPRILLYSNVAAQRINEKNCGQRAILTLKALRDDESSFS